MTTQHLKSLSRLAGRIRLAFDGDRAGVNATERAINLAQEVGVELEVVSLPDGVKDPDELIQKDPALWQAAIDQSQPAVDWVIARYAEMENLKSAEGKRRFSTIALRIVRGLKDPVEQEHYLSVISEKTGASITALKAKLSNEKVAEHQIEKRKLRRKNRLQFRMKLKICWRGWRRVKNPCGVGWRRFLAKCWMMTTRGS